MDYFRKTKRNNLKRLIFYSFLFYILNLVQLKTGGIVFPKINETDSSQTFHYVGYLNGIYNTIFFKTSYTSFFSLFYNFILFIPYGAYISIYFNVKSLKKGILSVFLLCFGIEVVRFVFDYLGLVIKQGFDMSVILLNISGGILSFLLFKLIKNLRFSKVTGIKGA